MSANAKSTNAFANVIVGLLVVMAITLATASTIHFGVAVAGVDDPFPGAALPEAIISVVVLAGAQQQQCAFLTLGAGRWPPQSSASSAFW